MAIRLVKGLQLVEENAEPVSELELAVERYERLRKLKDEATLHFTEAEELLIERMGEQKSAKIRNRRVTVVRRDLTKIDEPKLKKILGATLWRKASKSVVDRNKLESLISTGEISVDQVASASQLVPAKPYVRVTEADRPEEGEDG